MSLRVVRTLTADRGDASERLDKVLQRHLSDVDAATRTQIQRWIEQGHVQVNGRVRTRSSGRVLTGDDVSVSLPAPCPRIVSEPEPLPLDVLYSDDLFIVVDKPAGLVAHPTYRHTSGTLMNGLLWLARNWPAGQRPSLVGRLDKHTSGLVVVARTAAAHATLQRVLASSWAEKSYLAVVYGKAHPPKGRIELRIQHSPVDRRRMVTSEATGQTALTTYERRGWVNAGDTALSLVHCRLGTGRTHQIRVHLSACGWPIVGDGIYGRPGWQGVSEPALASALEAFPRQALHAWRVSFPHPVTGARVTIDAPLPPDIRALLALARLGVPESETASD